MSEVTLWEVQVQHVSDAFAGFPAAHPGHNVGWIDAKRLQSTHGNPLCQKTLTAATSPPVFGPSSVLPSRAPTNFTSTLRPGSIDRTSSRFPILLESTEIPLLLCHVPLSTFVSVCSALW